MYTGMQCIIPLGSGGFDAIQNEDMIAPTSLIVAKNIRFDNDTVKRSGGLNTYHVNAVASTPNLAITVFLLQRI